MTISDLRALLDKATPGPWRYNEDRIGIESASVWAIEPDPRWDMEGSRVEVIHTQSAMSGNCVADIAAIVALRNAAPALLDLAEAVRAYRDAVDEREAVASADGVAGGEEPGEMTRLAIAETNAYRAMLAAIDALEKAK